MATYNTTFEQAQEYHRATSGGRGHGKAAMMRERTESLRREGKTVFVCTPNGDAVATIYGYTCHRCKQSLAYTYGRDFNAMMAAHAPSCGATATSMPYDVTRPCWNCKSLGVVSDGDVRRCSTCSVDLSRGDSPIAVGDYVRWEFPRFDKFAEGEVVDMASPEKHDVAILVDRCTKEWSMDDTPHPRPGVAHVFGVWGIGRHDDPVMRRIPRPGNAKADVRANEEQRWQHLMGVDYAKRNDSVDALMYAMQYVPAAKCLGCGRAMVAAGSARICGLCLVVATAKPTAPVMPPTPVTRGPTLYDGLTAIQCYQRWAHNRAALEFADGPPLYVLTHVQIAVGRAAYQSDALTEWADDLRALVAASDAARKAREPSVLVQIEDD